MGIRQYEQENVFFARSNLDYLKINFNEVIVFPAEGLEGESIKNYDKKTGVYTAPIRGIYTFSVCIAGSIHNIIKEKGKFMIMCWISSGSSTPQVIVKTPLHNDYFNVNLNFTTIMEKNATAKVYVNDYGNKVGDYIIGERGNGCFFSGCFVEETAEKNKHNN